MTKSGNVTGDPLAEPALRVDTREELVYLLGQACELEHGLMCEYLYAQFSLKRGPDEGLTDGQLARVQAWEKALIAMIKQEMLHLALATNILTAVGASAMGPDASDVVDPQLRVRGVTGLRVVDASVLPVQVAGNTQAPAMAVAWIAAGLILEDS